jgi:hypothetical protein
MTTAAQVEWMVTSFSARAALSSLRSAALIVHVYAARALPATAIEEGRGLSSTSGVLADTAWCPLPA